ncbi:DUF4340 domain-containing protein [Myxococcota bacterium]|nr:DUF4340 domain-containing protein [Myxococcota bacterium]
MNEIKIHGALLVLLLGAAWYSWTREEPAAGATSDKVTIVDGNPGQLEGVTFYAKTATVTVTRKKAEKGPEYHWFTVEQSGRKKTFVGNDKVEKMLEGFAPLKGLRSLGRLEGTELAETKLDKPERKLVLAFKSGPRALDVGGRTNGARDHYVRIQGQSEVFLVGSAVLGDLELPEGRFMQRKLRNEPLTEVGKVQVAANGKTKVIVQQNAGAANEAFWAAEAKPDEKNETLGNWVDKLDKLTAVDYGSEESKLPTEAEGTPILEATWYGDGGDEVLSTISLWKAGDAAKPDYYARSTATRLPVKLSRLAAEQLEKDLETVLAD